MELASKTFSRGLTEIEVAVIKRMRLMGLPRDYIMSFILEPGRIVSPAAVGEVANGTIGPEVAPAPVGVVEIYVKERITAVRAIGRAGYLGPVSPWRVQQVLTWARPDQKTLLPDEGYETEFKIIFGNSDDKKFGYLKSLASFANFRGGYILFGVTNAGQTVGFDHNRFLDFDWDHFDQLVESTFQPYFSWAHAVVEIPEGEGIRLDANIVKSLAALAKKEPKDYQWLIDAGFVHEPKRIGVLYAYPNDIRPVECVRRRGEKLKKEMCYRRLKARNQGYTKDEFIRRFGKAPTIDHESARLERLRLRDFDAKVVAGERADLEPQTGNLFES